jgi:hypothetical protein
MRIITSVRIRISVLFAVFFLSFGSIQAQLWSDNGAWGIYSADNFSVGIGTHTPTSALTVASTGGAAIVNISTNNPGNCWLQVGNSVGHMNVGVGAATPHPYLWSSTGSMFIGSDGSPAIFISGPNVGINTMDTKGYLFAVNGSAVFTKVVVKANGSWPDYVFNTDHRLRPLREVAQYIQQNHHLPELPSAAEVEKDGVDVGQNQAVLLKKIEELTLYVIAMEKDKNEMKRTISKQQKALSRLSALINSKK